MDYLSVKSRQVLLLLFIGNLILACSPKEKSGEINANAPVESKPLSEAEKLLEQSIAFHDPNGRWDSFQETLQLQSLRPDSSKRMETVKLDLVSGTFMHKRSHNDQVLERFIEGEDCYGTLNGVAELPVDTLSKYRLTCESVEMYRNYYEYLYGLPMKLKDPGTIIDPQVQQKTFKGKDYEVIKVTYDPAVGEDIWYFYFDKETKGMEVYQFFHDESINDGEYILLSGLHEQGGIQLPKDRSWFMNADDRFLATDMLK